MYSHMYISIKNKKMMLIPYLKDEVNLFGQSSDFK